MKSRYAALIVLTMLIVGMTAPMFAQSTDGLDADDYHIVVPGTSVPDKSIQVTLANGNSSEWTVYIVNVSEKYLSVSYDYVLDSKDVKVTSLPKACLLDPEGGSGSNETEGTISFAIDALSEPHDSIILDVIVSIADIKDMDSPAENHIIFDIKVDSVFDTSELYNKFFGIIPNTLPEPLNSPIVAAIVTMIVCALVTWLLARLLISRIAFHLSKNATEEDADKLQNGTQWFIVLLVTIFSINLGLKIMGSDSSILSTVSWVTYVISIVLMAVILWKVYVFIIESMFRRMENNSIESPLDTSLIPLFKMLGRILFWVAGTSAVLGACGVDLQGILISAGVISLGITLGAQNVLSQFFSGLVILTTRPFKAGDFLQINGTVYIVQKVKLMYTEFKNWAGDAIITMPNNVVTASTISNMTKDDEICKQYVYFSVAYGTDLDKAQNVMIEAAKKCDLVVEDAKHEGPTTRITSFLASGIEIRLSVYTPTFDDTGAAAGKLRALVYEAFRENDIEIPYDRIQIDILSDCSEKVPKTN